MFGFFSGRSAASQRLVIEGSEFSAPVKPGQTILQAATSARIKFPNMCNVGECGTCRCRLREGRVKLMRDITRHISVAEIEQGYILGCQAVPDGDVIVQVPGLSATDTVTAAHQGRIVATDRLTHDILEVRVEVDRKVHYSAGQYARLSVPGAAALSDVERNYSFASAVGADGTTHLHFYIRHVPGGLFTDWLFATDRTGEVLSLSLPYGDFGYHPSERPLLCIAGGSGLAPIKALLEQLQADGIERSVTLLFGARTQADLYGLPAINVLAARWPASFAFHPVLSAEPKESDWTGRRGFVTDHLPKIVPNLAEHDAYLCGPPAMLDAALAHMQDMLPPDRIHFDKFLDQSSLV